MGISYPLSKKNLIREDYVYSIYIAVEYRSVGECV